jgi:hypothetical protein
MAQLRVVYQGKGASLVGKAWRYGAMGGTWEEGPAEGQVIVSLQVQDRNYQPLLSSLRDDPDVIEILNCEPKSKESPELVQ